MHMTWQEIKRHKIGATLYSWCYQNRWAFIVAMLAAAAVHYPIYAYQLRNMDSMHVGSLYIAD